MFWIYRDFGPNEYTSGKVNPSSQEYSSSPTLNNVRISWLTSTAFYVDPIVSNILHITAVSSAAFRICGSSSTFPSREVVARFDAVICVGSETFGFLPDWPVFTVIFYSLAWATLYVRQRKHKAQYRCSQQIRASICLSLPDHSYSWQRHKKHPKRED